MSGETERHVSGWTVDTLREHLVALMDERDRQYRQRFDAQEQAVSVALEQTKTRFENVNEWRGTVTDLLSNAMPRREGEARSEATSEKIGLLQSRLDKLEGRGLGITATWGVLITVLMVGMGVIGFIFR